MPMRAETFKVCAVVASSEAAPGDAAMRSDEGAVVTATRRDCSGALVPTVANTLRLHRRLHTARKATPGIGRNAPPHQSPEQPHRTRRTWQIPARTATEAPSREQSECRTEPVPSNQKSK